MKYLNSISNEQVAQLFKSAFIGLIGHFIVVTMIAFSLYINNSSIGNKLFIWVISHYIIILLRTISVKMYSLDSSKTDNVKWLLTYTIGGFLTGLTWGAVVLLLNETHPPELEYLMVAVVVGLAASGISTLGSVFICYASFALPMVAIDAIWMTMHKDSLHTITGLIMLVGIAYLLSSAFKYSQFMAKTILQNAELKEGSLDIIKHLSMAGEYRDTDTANHVIRMSKYCELLAKEAGYDREFYETILYASPMHDVGKIGIPDGILLKPGKLTHEEFEIMKNHSEIGASILSSERSEIIKMAKVIASTHHEKYDGTGYPNKLKGKDIPIEGRIAAICDVFDALTSERPYKQAWPVDKAVAHIKEQSGKHFDPDLSYHFLNILEEILVQKEKYKDGSGKKLTAFS